MRLIFKTYLLSTNPHIRQNTSLLVNGVCQIRGGCFYIHKENLIEADNFDFKQAFVRFRKCIHIHEQKR